MGDEKTDYGQCERSTDGPGQEEKLCPDQGSYAKDRVECTEDVRSGTKREILVLM